MLATDQMNRIFIMLHTRGNFFFSGHHSQTLLRTGSFSVILRRRHLSPSFLGSLNITTCTVVQHSPWVELTRVVGRVGCAVVYTARSWNIDNESIFTVSNQILATFCTLEKSKNAKIHRTLSSGTIYFLHLFFFLYFYFLLVNLNYYFICISLLFLFLYPIPFIFFILFLFLFNMCGPQL
jgi:hypothetical protein